MHIGVAFRNEKDKFVCSVGGDAFVADTLSNLGNDVDAWVVSLTPREMIALGIEAHALFRSNDFFRTKIETIRQELIGNDLIRGATFASRVASRIMCLARAALGIDSVHPLTLRHAIRERLLPIDIDWSHTPIVLEAIESATQEFARIAPTPEKGNVFALCAPRIAHAKAITNLTVPSPLQPAIRVLYPPFPDRADAIRSWIESVGLPMLIKGNFSFQVRTAEESVYEVKNIAPTRYRKKGVMGEVRRASRKWFTHLDALFLLEAIDKIQIESAIVFEETILLDAHPAVEKVLALFGEEAEASLSCAIFAENIWTAFATGNAPPLKKDVCANPMTPFIRAKERIAMARVAQTLIKAGFRVIGYGTGRVLLAEPLERIVEAAFFADLIPYAGMVACNTPLFNPEKTIHAITSARLSMLAEDLDAIDEEIVTVTQKMLHNGEKT